MICFLMRMDKRLRVQLFFLALIVVSERFAEGDSSTVPAPAGRKCHVCSDDECDDPRKVKTKDCTSLCLSAVLEPKQHRNRRITIKRKLLRNCSLWPETQCVFDSFPDHCFLPKSNPDQLDKVEDCARKINPKMGTPKSVGYDKVCFCDGDLCNDKNLPTGETSTTEDSGGSTTAKSPSVRIHTRPFIPFSLAIETIVVAAGLKMNV